MLRLPAMLVMGVYTIKNELLGWSLQDAYSMSPFNNSSTTPVTQTRLANLKDKNVDSTYNIIWEGG